MTSNSGDRHRKSRQSILDTNANQYDIKVEKNSSANHDLRSSELGSNTINIRLKNEVR